MTWYSRQEVVPVDTTCTMCADPDGGPGAVHEDPVGGGTSGASGPPGVPDPDQFKPDIVKSIERATDAPSIAYQGAITIGVVGGTYAEPLARLADSTIDMLPGVGTYRNLRSGHYGLAMASLAVDADWMVGALTDVYVGVKEGEAVYTGITNNMARRQGEWGERFDLQAITGEPLPRGQARAIEQAMILRNPGFLNKINSISPRRAHYEEAVEWGMKWLSDHGF